MNNSSCIRIARFLGVDFVHLLVEDILRRRYYFQLCLKYPAGNTNDITNVLIYHIYISIEYFSQYWYQMASCYWENYYSQILQRFNKSVHSITTYTLEWIQLASSLCTELSQLDTGCECWGFHTDIAYNGIALGYDA